MRTTGPLGKVRTSLHSLLIFTYQSITLQGMSEQWCTVRDYLGNCNVIHNSFVSPHRRNNHNYEPPIVERGQREYNSYPSRPLPPRDDYPRPSPRDSRYDYPAPAPAREYRRPPSPREYRDYGPPPPGGARNREYDDHRRGLPPMAERDRFPAPAPPPPADYRGRYPAPPDPAYRGYPAPPPADYDRYDRRPTDRAAVYPSYRPRSPPRGREEYDRAPPRSVHHFIEVDRLLIPCVVIILTIVVVLLVLPVMLSIVGLEESHLEDTGAIHPCISLPINNLLSIQASL